MNKPVIIGDCQLYLGDCREILPEIGKVDAVVTDPPYGIFDHGGKWGHKTDLQWDRKPAANTETLIKQANEIIIWGGNYFTLPPSRGWLVWFKRDSVPSASSVELAWTSFDMNSRLIDQTIAATNAERCGHPTQKPLRVMEWTISFISPNAKVLDPFMGSGTTGVACVKTGRKFIGIEIEKKYFDIACQRIEKAMNEKAMELPIEVKKEKIKTELF